MDSSRVRRNLVWALYVNAALLVAILVVLVARGGEPRFMPVAYGQNQPPIAGGAGVFMMPAQFSANTWGCYLMDVDAQTLCAYQYYPGDKQLKLAAARNFRFDRRLSNFNTVPSPQEIQDLVQREQQAMRGVVQTTQPAAP